MPPTHSSFDVFVIGGGVNGTGIARDAAGRGYSVMLAEMDDLASGTSSKATKLIHGGLRYLEYYEFRLVREALIEREVLWAAAPHIIWPLRFVLPHHRGLRPAWFLRLGLFVYDHLGGRRMLPPTRTLDLSKDAAGKPLKDGFHTAFEYSDCWVNDARFVALTARDAADRGAVIRTRTKVVSAKRQAGGWTIEIEDQLTGERETATARLLVNAAGPWVDHVIRDVVGESGKKHVRLVKGSHIVTRKLYEHDRCYFFQNADGRIFFAIPYEDDFTLIGTTDEDYEGGLADIAISEVETEYLLKATSAYFREPVTREDIVWSYAGVRPLYDDGASEAKEATRDYVLKLDGDAATGPLINVFGGKLTTSRRLAQSLVDMVGKAIGKKGERWTRTGTLPGGDFPPAGFETVAERLRLEFPQLEAPLMRRLARAYGTRVPVLLEGVTEMVTLGIHFGADLYQREVDYLMTHEWAVTAEDVLWRRGKLGLRISAEDAARLGAYMASKARGKTG